MKIGAIQPFPLKIKARERLQGGTFSYSHYQTVLVRASVDGVVGWGEAMTRSDPDATAILVRQLGGQLVGEEFDDVKDPWERLWRGLRVRGHTRGVEVEALSGIEIALQDALGKIRREPLCKMLSPHCARDVPAFAGSIFSSRGPLGAQIEFAQGEGLVGAKVKIGFGVEKDERILREARRRWPEGVLVADANGAYGGRMAMRACRSFEPLDLAWFEEPVLSDDLEGYALLKGSGVRIGGGESWSVGDFQKPIQEGLIGVLEPSVSRCGGVLVEVRAAKMAKARGIEFSPMTGMNSAVSLAASIHAASAVGTIGVEYNPFPNPIQTELAVGLERPSRGRVRVPERDGLGIEVDERFVKANSS